MSLPDITPLLPDDAELEARQAALVGELLGEQREARRRSPRWRRHSARAAAVVLLAGIASGGVAVAVTLLQGRDVVPAGIACQSEVAERPSSQTIVPPTGDPVDACRAVWRRQAQDPTSGVALPVPSMTACARAKDSITVYPTADATVCARFKLQPLPKDFTQFGERAARISRALRALENPPGCPSGSQMMRAAQQALERADLADVPIERVDARNLSCAFAAGDSGRALVWIPRE